MKRSTHNAASRTLSAHDSDVMTEARIWNNDLENNKRGNRSQKSCTCTLLIVEASNYVVLRVLRKQPVDV